MVACAEPRSKIPTLSEGVAQHPRRPLASFLGLASFKPDISLNPLPADCPPIFHLPYTLPSSVSRKPFIYHSYENTGGVRVFFPFWNSAHAIKACVRPCAIIGDAACASDKKASWE